MCQYPGSISDEGMAQLGDFVPRERHLPEEDLPALDHDFFAFGIVRVLQRGEADEAQEEFPAGVDGHRRVHPRQRIDGIAQAAPQALDGLSSVLPEEAQQRADGGHRRGDVGVVPQLRPEDEELSLLVIVIDTNPIWWGKRAQGEAEFTLSKCMDAAMVLGNSHLFMSRTNRLAVIASHTQESRFLYPGKRWASADLLGDGGNSVESNCSGSKDGKYELLTAINDAIAEEIKDLMTKTDMMGQQTETLLAGSLAKALCYINKISKEVKANQEMKSRILVIKAAEDSALQYMNFMNVIFAAQKQSILIDACVLDSDSGLLQQACDITGGIYLKVPHLPSLLQYLLWVFLPDQEQRSQLVLPPPVHVDYRAACFCHRNLIEIGYVCSVCLSIFCNFSPICSTCETAFKISLPPVMKAKKKKLKLAV